MSVSQRRSSSLINGHKELRAALRDTERYSSDLQGDADVRDYRQIPLEIDPPRHHLFRSALSPFFVKPTIEQFVLDFKGHAEKLLQDYFSNPPSNVIANLALPLVMKNLGVIYKRPQDVSEWISWGPDVWTAESEERSGKVLHRYLDKIYSEAVEAKHDDIWREIAHLEIEDKVISEEEFRGIAGVMLAGGRDTVVKLFTGILWHFAKKPEELERFRSEPAQIPRAVGEFLRFLTPLPVMNRTTVPESLGRDLPDDRYVGMNFISANFDESVFENPFEINLNRERNPHLSFGFGPHTCLGNHVAEIEARVFLEVLLESKFRWEIVSENIEFHSTPYEVVPREFSSLVLRRVS
jgi:cytochrome P450